MSEQPQTPAEERISRLNLWRIFYRVAYRVIPGPTEEEVERQRERGVTVIENRHPVDRLAAWLWDQSVLVGPDWCRYEDARWRWRGLLQRRRERRAERGRRRADREPPF